MFILFTENKSYYFQNCKGEQLSIFYTLVFFTGQ